MAHNRFARGRLQGYNKHMKNLWEKFINSGVTREATVPPSTKPAPTAGVFIVHNPERKQKIEKGAKDFAVRFEGVMKELSNG